jgi:hypothetical protein
MICERRLLVNQVKVYRESEARTGMSARASLSMILSLALMLLGARLQ